MQSSSAGCVVGDDLDLVGRVRLDTSGLHEGVSAISSSLGKIGALVAGAFAVDKIVGFGKAGIGVAADMQQTSIAFETMLGSGEKAQGFLKQLRAFAASTPFEFPELATAASSLISVGIDANKVIPIMTTLGNTTAGMGTGSEGVKRATVALQQMSAAGRITGEDLNQLRDAGVPVFDLLAAATGKSKEEVAKLAQQGKLGKKELGQLMDALESGKGLERFNGLMDKQSKTLKGVISTLKDTLSGIAIDFITPYLPAMTAALQGFSDLIQNKLVPALHVFIDDVGKAFNAIGNGWETADAKVSPGVGLMTQLFTAFGAAAKTIFVDIAVAWGAFSDGFSDTSSIGSEVGGLATTFAIVGAAVSAFLVIGKDLLQWMLDHETAVKNAVIVIGSLYAAYKTLEFVNETAGKINSFVSSVQAIPGNAKKATEEIRQLATTMKTIGSKTVDIVTKGAKEAVELVKDIAFGLGKLEDKVVNVAVNYKEEHSGENVAKSGAKGFVQSFMGAVAGVIVAGLDIGAIAGAIGTALAGIGSIIAGIVFAPEVLIAAAVIAVAALVLYFRKEIVDFFTNDLPHALDIAMNYGEMFALKGKDLVTGLWNGAKEVFEQVKTFFAQLPYDIGFAVGYVLGTLYVQGRDLVTGLWTGAKEVFEEVKKFFTQTLPDILVAIGDTAKTLYEKGRALMQGAWDGINFVWNANFHFWSDLPGEAARLIGDVTKTLYEKGRQLLGGAWDGIQFAWNDPKGFFGGIASTIKGLVGDVTKTLKEKGGQIISGLSDGVHEAWRGLGDWFGGLAQTTKDKLGDAKGWLHDVGLDVMHGLENGIKDGIKDVLGTISSVGHGIVDGMRKAVDSHSPSRKMMAVGSDIMAGLRMGIRDNIDSVLDVMTSVGAGLSERINIPDLNLTGRLGGALNVNAITAATSAAAGGSSGDTSVSLHFYGNTDGDSVRGAIPDLVNALKAGVGKK